MKTGITSYKLFQEHKAENHKYHQGRSSRQLHTISAASSGEQGNDYKNERRDDNDGTNDCGPDVKTAGFGGVVSGTIQISSHSPVSSLWGPKHIDFKSDYSLLRGNLTHNLLQVPLILVCCVFIRFFSSSSIRSSFSSTAWFYLWFFIFRMFFFKNLCLSQTCIWFISFFLFHVL